ncbi:hypothetical protein QWY31_05880 [Cytophagales bacterium LB-30]|uniref:DUF2946 domain-containing protein n=1 Tax=Shiella aurantiaca TaxID=3058365 RepID=A0ABT8F3J0_9BACT|nr:hypothetical protein [Shiella aurantiaca]MDN4165022.1 hypothetical protein [Shiella aurantiaca]
MNTHLAIVYTHLKAQLKQVMIGVWLVLFSFIVIVRPILPFAEYALRKEYIAQNLCKNKDLPELQCEGKCYFMQQLKKSQETAPNQDSPNQSRLSFHDCFFIQDAALSGLPVSLMLLHTTEGAHASFYQSIVLERLVPPPQA